MNQTRRLGLGRRVLLPLAATALLLVGCGDAGEEDAPTTAAETSATETSGAQTTGPATTDAATTATETTAAESASTTEGSPAEGSQTVGVSQLVEHPSLDLHVEGMIDRLAEEGFVDGEGINVEIEFAAGDVSQANTIASRFVGDEVDVLVGVATPSAQAAVNAAQDTDVPVVYMAVSDPIGAGLIDTVDEPSGTNVTGMYNYEPVPEQLAVAQQITPDIGTLGVIYNAGEDNSVAAVEQVRTFAEEQGWELVEATVASTNEVQTAATSLASRVDAVFMPQDNTVASALEALVAATREENVPLFASDVESVRRGALATLGKDDFEAGRQAGGIVARVLEGEAPGEIVSEIVESKTLAINSAAADELGIEIPEEVVEEAEDVAGG